MRLSSEAERDHRRLVLHTIQATTEQFRPARAAELDDSYITECPGCGHRYDIRCVTSLCPVCRTHLPIGGTS